MEQLHAIERFPMQAVYEKWNADKFDDVPRCDGPFGSSVLKPKSPIPARIALIQAYGEVHGAGGHVSKSDSGKRMELESVVEKNIGWSLVPKFWV